MNEILLSLVQTAIIISFYYIFALKIIKRKEIDVSFFNLLFIYHLFFCLIFFIFIYFEISDAKSVYFFSSVSGFDNFVDQEISSVKFELGQGVMIFIIRALTYPLQLTLFSSTFLFGMFSFTGLIILYWVVTDKIDNSKIFEANFIKIFFFFPSLHFWQMSMSKDSLVFLGLMCFILFQKNLIKYFHIGFFSLTLIFLLRPYLMPFLLVFTFINFIINKKIGYKIKLLLTCLTTIPAIFIIFYSLRYVGIDIAKLFDSSGYMPINFNNILVIYREIEGIIITAQSNALSQNAGIDKSNLNFFFQIFIYLFGPLNFFTDNILYRIASIENFFLLIYIMLLISFKKILCIDAFRIIILLIFISLLLILSLRTSNYGISMRQKWMILPFFIVFLSNYMPKKINEK
ncbi:hypothetical protein OAP76_07795 [Alphaproteobacteria bacterium]|nr:hypothetical protein [Alphaproteobacteria bacterium]